MWDKIYAFKDYPAEALRLVEVIQQLGGKAGGHLLDVACGTGRHLEYLKEHFTVEGLDLNLELIEIARQRNPGIPFHLGDMLDFDLERQFDVVTCLFSSIGYVKTLENLGRAVSCMARHLRPGGYLLIEPWFTPEMWYPDTVHALFIDEPDLKIARMNTSHVDGRLSYFDLHYLIGTPEKTEHLVERHELGLFTRAEMEEAFTAAGLSVNYDKQGLTGRGLYIARRTGGAG
jgi:SAM-dependent methyltransferase